MLIVDRASGRCLRAGWTFTAALGYAPSDVAGRSVLELVHADDRGRYEAALRQIDGGASCACLDVRLGRNGGSTVWESFTILPARHAGRLRIVAREMTGPYGAAGEPAGRHAAIAARPAVDADADRPFSHAQTLLSMVEFDGRIRRVNAAWHTLGYEAVDLAGTSLYDYMHPDDREKVLRWFERLIADGTAASVTARCRRTDGAYRWIAWSGGSFGAEQCIYAFGNDITDQKRAEHRLFESYSNTERLLASISSILIGLDGAGHVTRWNSVAEATFHLTADAVMGVPFVECGIAWSDRSLVARLVQTVEMPARFPDLRFRRDQRDRFVSLTVNDVEGLPGGVQEFLVLGADVTDHRILEEQLRQAQKLEGIGQLAAGIAHEINTPIQYIGDNLRFLAETATATTGLFAALGRIRAGLDRGGAVTDLMPDVQQMCRDAESADVDYLQGESPKAIAQSLEGVDRIARIVRAMHEFSRPAASDAPRAELNRSVETTLVVAHNELKYVAEIETSLDPELLPVRCAASEINQVLIILLINAAQAIGQRPRMGRITVSTHRDGDWAEVRVSDTGSGISESAQPHVFEPFFTTKPVGGGTGQGLSVAYGIIVTKHGGRIWFETQEGCGTTVFVRLPMAIPAPVLA